jgi:hypothetical protein
MDNQEFTSIQIFFLSGFVLSTISYIIAIKLMERNMIDNALKLASKIPKWQIYIYSIFWQMPDSLLKQKGRVIKRVSIFIYLFGVICAIGLSQGIAK